MRTKVSVARYVRPRWNGWLRTTLSEHGVAKDALVEALAHDPDDDNTRPRSRVNSWLAEASTVSAGTAFRVGQTLGALGVGAASGPVAVYAAGHFGALIKLFESMAFLGQEEYLHRTRIPTGASRAQMHSKHAVAQSYWNEGSSFEQIVVRLYCLLPTAFHQIDFDSTILSGVVYPPNTIITAEFERDFAASARDELSLDEFDRQQCQAGWDKIGSHSRTWTNLDGVFDAAMSVLSVSFLDPAEGARIAWSILRHRLRGIAKETFKRCEPYLSAYDKYVYQRCEGMSYEIPVSQTDLASERTRRKSAEG